MGRVSRCCNAPDEPILARIRPRRSFVFVVSHDLQADPPLASPQMRSDTCQEPRAPAVKQGRGHSNDNLTMWSKGEGGAHCAAAACAAASGPRAWRLLAFLAAMGARSQAAWLCISSRPSCRLRRSRNPWGGGAALQGLRMAGLAMHGRTHDARAGRRHAPRHL